MTFDITLVNTTALWWDALFVWPRLDVEPVRVVAHTTAFELQHTHRPRRCHRLTDWVVVLRPARHKIGHFGDISPRQYLGLVWKKLNLTQQKYAFTNQKKCTTTQNKHKKTKAMFSRLLWQTAWKHTHTHTFNGPLSRTTRVSRHQKGKTNLDFTEARDSEWQWHQLGHMQVCTSLQTDNHVSRPTNSVKALKAKVSK